jgi:membrane associated rhomboid family serine protease
VIIPLTHDNMQGRRWPVITMGLVVLNLFVFLATHWSMQQDAPQRTEVRNHILMLAGMHPELTMSPDAQALVADFQKHNPGLWSEIQSPNREVADAWDAKMRLIEEPENLQKEMDSLTEQFSALNKNSLLDTYAFLPAHPTAISYITANFLHGGWLHLIGNMWFLWLAGAILEDTWGRLIYPLFYLAAGAAAMIFYGWLNSGSTVPTIGASGAVAALMGAFLFRFATTKIEVAIVFGLRSLTNLALGKGIRFKAAAYWLLPLWLLGEIFWGAAGVNSGVAHWAHVGGFLFGALVAVGLKYSGLEHKANQAIEAKVSWTADPAIVQATEQMEQGKLDDAVATLQGYLVTKPDSLEAYSILPQIYWRKNDVPAFQQAIVKRCQLHLKAQNLEPALQDYEEFVNSGGGNAMPASTWLELARAIEGQQHFDRAASEYERLAEAHPGEKQSILALLAAGRLCLKRLHRPEDALRNYQAAANSKVPHLDWDANIQAGIYDSESALATGAMRTPKA